MMDSGREKKLFRSGYRLVGAVDEAGIGPLAGPVVAACVTLRPEFFQAKDLEKTSLDLIKDSKKLTAKRREQLFVEIKENFFEVGIGMSDCQTIDRINILEASFLAMKKALGALKHKPDFLLLDGRFKIPNLSIGQEAVIDGDNLVFSIAAASIIAKVARDQIMEAMGEKYPGYGFEVHKGYGTRKHMENLKKLGPCPIHRRSFAPVREAGLTKGPDLLK